jgi:hypothetical protein
VTVHKPYPFDKWFKRNRSFNLIRGKDFEVMPHVMAQQIRNAAHKHQISVSIKIDEETLHISIGTNNAKG